MTAGRIPPEILRREAVVLIWSAFEAARWPKFHDQRIKFTEQYDVLNDEIWARLDFDNEKAFWNLDREAYEQLMATSLDNISDQFVKRLVACLPRVQLARCRAFKFRKMKAKQKARTWRMPFLRRKNIWVGV